MPKGTPTEGLVNEANATSTSDGVFFGVITGVARPFREPGVRLPDPLPPGSPCCVPRFDTNPERIRVDSDGQTGATALNVGTGAVVSGLVGPLDFVLRSYTILPDAASRPSVLGGPTATAVTPPASDELTVATFDLQRFFDTVDDPAVGEPVLTAAAFDKRLNKASLAIRNFLHTPDIIGVEEVENLTTLQALASRIGSDAMAASQPDPGYQAYLVEGNDVGGIDVGFLVKTALVSGGMPRVTVGALSQEGAAELFPNPDSSTALLNDRPPLVLEAGIHHSGGSFPLTAIVVHQRSLGGIDSTSPGPSGWPTLGDQVRAKRAAQAEFLADLVQDRQAANPLERIVLLGDFNAFEFSDGYVDVMGTVQGTPAPADQVVLVGPDLVDPDLTNLIDTAAAGQRYSFVFDGNAQSLDHVLINSALGAATLAGRIEHARISADFPEIARNDPAGAERLSDHDPIVAYFSPAPDCTRNLGYWKNHPESWPVDSLPLGDETYSQAELLALLGGKPKGDASRILARQLIVAKLNIAAGADPSGIAPTIMAADQWLTPFSGKLPYGVKPSSANGRIAIGLAEALEEYNRGELPDGPPSCD
jgi:hypothetical protein